MEQGANVIATDRREETPYDIAVQCTFEEIAEFLKDQIIEQIAKRDTFSIDESK